MAESADDDRLFWVDPEQRGIFPLDGLKVSRSLARTVRSDRFTIVTDRDFQGVIDGCAAPAPGRPNTWINRHIRTLFGQLFERGHVHTVEAYQDGALVGGLYGLHLGGAFFGESMFHRATDASKVCLVHLAARMVAGGFALLDTQFITPHLASLGATEVPKDVYRARLAAAIDLEASFDPWGGGRQVDGATALAILAP
jgi:leucyl/phenylalanyl-tRNA--protein transferase